RDYASNARLPSAGHFLVSGFSALRRYPVRRRTYSRRNLSARCPPRPGLRLRQREVGAPRGNRPVCHCPRARHAGLVCPVRRRRGVRTTRTLVQRGLGLADAEESGTSRLLALFCGRLGTPRLRPVRPARAELADDPRQLVRGGGLVPLGGTPITDRG